MKNINYKELESKINEVTVWGCDIDYLEYEIEGAIEDEETTLVHSVSDEETIIIDLETYEIEVMTRYSKEELRRIYAIKEYYSMVGRRKSLEGIDLDMYFLYADIEEYIECMFEWSNCDSDEEKEETEEFARSNFENFIKTSWGYLEEVR